MPSARVCVADGRLKAWDVAENLPGSTQTVKAHRANIRRFGTITAPRNRENPSLTHLGTTRPERSDRTFAEFAKRVMAMADSDNRAMEGQSRVKSVERMKEQRHLRKESPY
ncbi:hypothetical protein CLCR_11456 [Cladophialophora carrionii]|uniref:Uncharacterized protein n=1 Tax=Cladophialophora carrionii TaxID=86049 RepID=A0A1C1D2P8_9EURO|nr:hypothetical protein CLCR_11456 [Cladophialophora carrionii]